MDFGPNSALVEEVIATLSPEFLVRGLVLGQVPIQSAQFDIVVDHRQATRISRAQDLWNEGFDDWCLIAESALSSIMFPNEPLVAKYRDAQKWLQELGQDVGKRFAASALETSDACAQWVAGDRFKEMQALIERDFAWIATARLQCGISYEPFETMFSAYRQGGWPCGWKGEYPDGKMVVYHIGPKV